MKSIYTLSLMVASIAIQSSAFAGKGHFNVSVNNDYDYLGVKHRAVTVTYDGKKEFEGIWGNAGMALESKPKKSLVITSNTGPQDINFYSSPNSENHTPENIIFQYHLDGISE